MNARVMHPDAMPEQTALAQGGRAAQFARSGDATATRILQADATHPLRFPVGSLVEGVDPEPRVGEVARRVLVPTAVLGSTDPAPVVAGPVRSAGTPPGRT